MWVDTGDILFNVNTGCSICIEGVRVGKLENYSLTWKDKTGETEFVIVVTETAEAAQTLLRQLSKRLKAWGRDNLGELLEEVA